MVYNADLTPAVGAVVKFFEINNTEPSFETKTNDKGQYAFSGLAKGTYNVIASKDSSIAFQDSVFISSSSNSLEPDTLEKSGSFTGIVRLQVNHNPSTVTVQVLGTDIYSEVDSKGWFTLKPLAKGEYNLRLVTTLPDYSPTFKSIKVQGGKNDTLSDTIIMKYTGIPVVTGLRASYDTLNGVVHLSWNQVSYYDFQDYLIYKDWFGNPNLSTTPIKAIYDTTFADTIFIPFEPGTPTDGTFLDENDRHLIYRVAVRSNTNTIGQTYKYADIIAASRMKVTTTFSSEVFHIKKGFKTDSASVNDSLLYIVKFSNPTRWLKRVTWTALDSGAVISTHTLDTSKTSGADTVRYAWSETGEKRIECKVLDGGDTEWKDTITVYVIDDFPSVEIIAPSAISLNSPSVISASLYDKYSNITKCEWSIGNRSSFTATTLTNPEATIVIKDTLTRNIQCFIRVTNEQGNTTYDSVTVPLNIAWEKINTPAAMKQIGSFFIFNNELVAISNENGYQMWTSSDGVNWKSQNQVLPMSGTICQPTVLNGKIWVLNLASKDSQPPVLWNSTDAVSWDSINLGSVINWSDNKFTYRGKKDAFFTSYNNKLFVGYTSENKPDSGSLWSSVDGENWVCEKKPTEKGVSAPTNYGGGQYYTVTINSTLYFSTFRAMVMNEPGIWIWSTQDWKSLDLVKAFDHADPKNGHTSSIQPITSVFGKLCLFMITNSTYGYSGKMLCFEGVDDFWECSDLPGSRVTSAIEFNKKIYVISDDFVWVSK